MQKCSKMLQSILTLLFISFFMKFWIAQIFWVERHLNVVLEYWNQFTCVIIRLLVYVTSKRYIYIYNCELSGRKIPGLNPTDLSKTIDLCTWPLFLLQWKVNNKWPTLIWSQVYIQGRESTYYDYTIQSSWNWEPGLVGPAPALCWGRATGVMCKIRQIALK